MMNNKRIASELNRIAKGLISADGVANSAGKYEKFTGTIKWKGSQGKVWDATFELINRGIIWEDGIWENGTWYNGNWENGTWRDGVWKDGVWWYGTWKDGTWESGIWMKGKWKRGRDKRGVEHLDIPKNWY